MSHPVEPIVQYCLSQKGQKYVFASEQSPLDPTPQGPWDCSELTQVSHNHFGVDLPDGAYNQWKFCKPISVEEALHIRGALLFVGDGTGSGRDAVHHVAVSLGDGTTIEARGHAWGVGTWSAVGRFDFAGLVPGVDYNSKGGPINQGGGVQVSQGSNSKGAVKFLQAMLNIQRAHSKPQRKRLKEDGVFGKETFFAVADFQRDYNDLMGKKMLKVDGVAGPATNKALGDIVRLVLHKA